MLNLNSAGRATEQRSAVSLHVGLSERNVPVGTQREQQADALQTRSEQGCPRQTAAGPEAAEPDSRTGKSSHRAATGEPSGEGESPAHSLRNRVLTPACPLGAVARERSRGAWRWEVRVPTCQTEDLTHRPHGGLVPRQPPERKAHPAICSAAVHLALPPTSLWPGKGGPRAPAPTFLDTRSLDARRRNFKQLALGPGWP